MTQDEKIFGKLGEISATLEYMKRSQVEIFDRLNVISAEGCAVGKEHERRVSKLEELPGKMLAASGVIAGILSALGIFINWLLGGHHR